MLDVVFINLISAGIVRLCQPVTDPEQPPGPPIDGTGVMRHLIAAAPGPAGQLINQCVEKLWQGCQTVGLPPEIAEPHLEALPALIATTGFSASDRRLILSGAQAADGSGLAAIAVRIVASANQDPELADQLDETILVYLLETLLKSFAAAHSLIAKIEPKLAGLLALPTPTGHAAEPLAVEAPTPAVAFTPPSLPPSPPKSAVTLAKIERANALGITVPLLEVITVRLINLTRSSDVGQANLLAAAADARSLMTRIQDLLEADFPVEPGPLGDVLTQFRAGRPAECDRLLASVEDRIVKQSISVSPPDIRFATAAIKIRDVRAGLEALNGRFVKAARHYGFALRYLPRTAHDLRGHFAEREAYYYELSALQNGTADGLDNAARALTSALAIIPSETPSVARALAETTLARLLMLLGEKELEPARFELAGQLLAAAQAVLAENPERPDYIRATVVRADVLTRLGETHLSSRLLEQAAFLYQSAIEATASGALALDQPALQEAAFGLNIRMALTLCALADITGDQVTRDAAITIIIDELPELLASELPAPGASWHTLHDPNSYSRRLLVARCHIGLARWHMGHGDHEPGAVHYERAAREYGNIGMPDAARAVRLRAVDDATPATSSLASATPHQPPAVTEATAA